MSTFENDLFISYAHIDNRAWKKDEEWVTALHRLLEILVAQKLGRDVRIWRDPKIAGNDEFGPEIIDQLIQAALLVSILSPRYCQSEWCIKELERFVEEAKKGRGLKVGQRNRCRVFKVIKTPPKEQPAAMEELAVLGYRFYEDDPSGKVDADTGKPIPKEFSPREGGDTYEKFIGLLDTLAYDVASALESMRGDGTPAEGHEEKTLTVYLAHATSDLRSVREQLERELMRHRYTVLPDRELPRVYSDLEKQLKDDMEHADLSVHFLGKHYAFSPEGDSRSISEIEVDIAKQHSCENGFKCIIWLPKQLGEAIDREQEQLIEKATNAPDQSPNIEVIRDTPDNLKTHVRDRLVELEEAQETPSDKADLVHCYLIYDKQDESVAQPVRSYLHEQYIEVLTPVFEGSPEEMRAHHMECLELCDVVLLYHGHSRDAWLQTNLRYLLRARAKRRTPFLTTAILLAPPATPDKRRVLSHEALVIDHTTEEHPIETTLKPLMTIIEKARKAIE